MLDPDLDNVDFTNPVFDHEKAKLRDAAVAIQAWYRMWRHRIPYLQLRESALIVQVSCVISVNRECYPQYIYTRIDVHFCILSVCL